MKSIRSTAFCLFLALSMLPIAIPGHAQDSDRAPGLLEELEKKLELGRHEQLVETIKRGDAELSEFTTDGCSGGLSAGWRYLFQSIDRLEENHGHVPPWESCCVSHDRDYHRAAGRSMTAEQSFAARLKADESLRRCVIDTGTERAPELLQHYKISAEEVEDIYLMVATLMYRAVRIGGVPCSGLPWRWGYGWPACK